MSRTAQDMISQGGPLPRHDSLTDLVAFAAATKVASYLDTKKQRKEEDWKHFAENSSPQRQVGENTTKGVGESSKDKGLTNESDCYVDKCDQTTFVLASDIRGNLIKKPVSLETTSLLLSGLDIIAVDFGFLESSANRSSLKSEKEKAVELLMKIPSTGSETEAEIEEPTSPKRWKYLPHSAERLLSALLAPQLREISLASNMLESLDLKPLANCANLKSLLLNSNRFESIDLSPLTSCSKLERLWLHHNQLKKITLDPLKGCPNLRSVYLDHNCLTDNVDLRPFESCKVLKSLRLGANDQLKELDITPLLNCTTLSVFEFSVTTKLIAYSKSKVVPSALKRHERVIQWKVLNNLPVQNSDNHSLQSVEKTIEVEKLRILLVGFGSNQIALESMFSKQKDLEVSSVSNIDSSNSLDTLKSLKNLQHFDAVVCEPCFDWFIPKVKMVHSDIPVIVVGSDLTSSAASACLRQGACCLIVAPLSAQDTCTIREWAEKHSHSNCELRIFTQTNGCNEKASIDSVSIEDKLVGLLNSSVQLEEPVESSLLSELTPDEVTENRKELKAIEAVFNSRSFVSEELYRSVAVACGLPSCCFRLLYSAVSKENHFVNIVSFGRFWKKRFLGRDCEERLFSLLNPRGNRLTDKQPLRTLIEDLLKRRLLRRVYSIAIQNQLVDCALECVLMGLSGTWELGSITKKTMKRARFCHALLEAERGNFKGPLGFLHPEKFDNLRRDFKVASQGHFHSGEGVSTVSLDDFLRFNHERNLLTVTAANSFFNVLVSMRSGRRSSDDHNTVAFHNELSLAEFARFFCAVSSVNSLSAVNVFYLVFDHDMDGVLSIRDFFHYYKEKARIYAREGLVLADVHSIWYHFLDMCCTWPDQQKSRDFLIQRDLYDLEPKERGFLLKAVFFRDDGFSLVDIRSSLLKSPVEEATDGSIE
eukprot:jgi/Galph1/3436/GphlegSOOS_G2068.1